MREITETLLLAQDEVCCSSTENMNPCWRPRIRSLFIRTIGTTSLSFTISEICNHDIQPGVGLTPCTSAGTPSHQPIKGLWKLLLSSEHPCNTTGPTSLSTDQAWSCSLLAGQGSGQPKNPWQLSVRDECPTINGDLHI